MTSKTVAATNSALSALSCGFSPVFTMPKIFSGSVWDDGPAVNEVTMYSSIESANAISAPEKIAGASCGRITRANACHGRAPRSSAASSRCGSIPSSRACTAISTNGKQNVVCAMIVVAKPSCIFRATNSRSRLTPMSTSGIAMGTNTNNAIAREPG